MGALQRHVHKLAYALITAGLVVTFVATTVGGFRLHHAAAVERQTIRTQTLETAILEHERAAALAAFEGVAAHDSAAGRRLRPALDIYLKQPANNLPIRRAVESELTRQSNEIHSINPAARSALIAALIGATALVAGLVWLFELERRAGRIDRDNAARAEELIRLRDEFVAVVSHELRTPLTSIIGYLELLLDEDTGELTTEQLSYLEIVQRSTSRLVELVGDLLLVAEAERGPLALEVADVDILALAADAAEAARPSANTRGVVIDVEPGSAGTVAGDPTRLAQMLDNLVSNAIKFTPEGGRVTVRAGLRGSDAVFEVADTGEGVAPADRVHLFDPFFRSRIANARAVPGTGLGLTITKAIVEAHSGVIEIEDTPGGGATFRVWLPVGERIAAFTR
jgi:signal transduction histidine kinase